MKKFLNIGNLKKIFLILILLTLYIFVSAYFYVQNVSDDLADSVFRLHIIANSNSTEDQNLKYKVRDNVIKYMDNLCENSTSKEETIKIVSNHLNDFTKIANNTILENGFNYNATVELGNFEFPTKNYGDISLPSGYYDALKIKLGNSSGQNWWCVLYPSLCFVDITQGIVPECSKQELEESLTPEEYEIISNQNNATINFKFKLIEFFTQNHILIAKK